MAYYRSCQQYDRSISDTPLGASIVNIEIAHTLQLERYIGGVIFAENRDEFGVRRIEIEVEVVQGGNVQEDAPWFDIQGAFRDDNACLIGRRSSVPGNIAEKAVI